METVLRFKFQHQPGSQITNELRDENDNKQVFLNQWGYAFKTLACSEEPVCAGKIYVEKKLSGLNMLNWEEIIFTAGKIPRILFDSRPINTTVKDHYMRPLAETDLYSL